MISSQEGTEERRPLAFFLAPERGLADWSSPGADAAAGASAFGSGAAGAAGSAAAGDAETAAAAGSAAEGAAGASG
jgi:hypothetical protein